MPRMNILHFASLLISPASVSAEPSPENEVAVIELKFVILVELSPTMLPFAFISPETVNELNVPSEVIFG